MTSLTPVAGTARELAPKRDADTEQGPAARSLDAVVAAAPSQTPAVAQPSAVSAPVQAPQVASAAPPLTNQLSGPIFTLKTAAAGDHIMTVRVAPDSIGPVTVRAHLGGAGIRIELMAPTDQGREALKAILPDLKRDLAQGGMSASLDLASGSGGSSQGTAGQAADPFGARQGAGQQGSGQPGSPRTPHAGDRAGAERTSPATPLRTPATGSTRSLDVYA